MKALYDVLFRNDGRSTCFPWYYVTIEAPNIRQNVMGTKYTNVKSKRRALS